MYKTNFFAVKSNSADKLKNFIKLVKRMGVEYNHDWGSINILDDYPRTKSDHGLGFSNVWDNDFMTGTLTCAMTPSTQNILDIDTPKGYRDAVHLVITELIEIESRPTLIFQDMGGWKLETDDEVVMVNTKDMDCVGFQQGEILIVESLNDSISNFITFKSELTGISWSFYGDRVLKLIR